MSFDERCHKLATLAVESFGRLGVEDSNFIDQLAAASSVVGGRDGGSMTRKRVVKEHLLQIISVTTDRSPFRGGCRASNSSLGTAKNQEGAGEGGDDRPPPMAWGRSLDAA